MARRRKHDASGWLCDGYHYDAPAIDAVPFYFRPDTRRLHIDFIPPLARSGTPCERVLHIQFAR